MRWGGGTHRLLSVRARLVAFALLCAVPVLLLSTLQAQREVRSQARHAADTARTVAERLQMRLGLVFATAESVGRSVGGYDLRRAEARERCSSSLLRARVAAGPLVRNVTILDPAGNVLCSAAPWRGPRNLSERPHLREALAQRGPVLSALSPGQLVDQLVLVLVVPILNANGEVDLVAAVALNAPALAHGLDEGTAMPVTLALLDRTGVLVSRSPAHPRIAPGVSFAESPLFRHARSHAGAVTEQLGLDGVKRVYDTRAVLYRGEPVMWIASGVDVEPLEAAARAVRWRELAIVLLLAGAVVVVAVMATRPLVLAWVRALEQVAAGVARGDYEQRVPLQVHDDLTPVESALNQMLDAVQADRAVLADSESRYRMLFEHSLSGVLQTTPDGSILAANAAACRMLGRPEAELLALKRGDLVDRADPRLAVLLRERQLTGRARGGLTMLRGDGSRIEVAIASSVYTDSQGRQRTVIVMQDMTEHLEARAELLRLNRELEARVARRTQELQQANRELEAFSYSVSHDLRAPVAVIRSFAEVLEESGAVQGDRPQHYLRRIRAAGQHMSELIDGLLALAHVSRGQLAWGVVDLSALAEEAAQQLADMQPDHRVEVDIAPGMHAVGDARLLRVVLFNLLANAWKFSGGRDRPRVSVGMADGADGEPVFCVRDNGDGFDPAHAHRLFVPFQRLHTAAEFPGLGIGLATVQRIVQRHGGRIWAEGARGGGAAFYFVLGVQEGSAAKPSAGAGRDAQPTLPGAI